VASRCVLLEFQSHFRIIAQLVLALVPECRLIGN
jgi:hypothetical protein